MSLNFPGSWRFEPPLLAADVPARISSGAREEFLGLIRKMAGQGEAWMVFEHFKRHFATACGRAFSRSSGRDWAEHDLAGLVGDAAENAPLFLGAFFEGCQTLEARGVSVPRVEKINAICAEHGIPFVIEPPNLRLTVSGGPSVRVPERPATIAERAREVLDQSLRRADELLDEGRGLESVREVLWLLESVSTEFEGLEIAGHVVEGGYFNEIARDLRRAQRGTTMDQALQWATQLQGYLSSPGGGGVRHGRDLEHGSPLSAAEARLFVNLALSYLSYLLAEHERLATPPAD
jgi:hypothetical protein